MVFVAFSNVWTRLAGIVVAVLGVVLWVGCGVGSASCGTGAGVAVVLVTGGFCGVVTGKLVGIVGMVCCDCALGSMKVMRGCDCPEVESYVGGGSGAGYPGHCGVVELDAELGREGSPVVP